MQFTYRMICLSQWHYQVNCLLHHLQSVQQTKKYSGELLIAIIMDVLVDNTITKANNHFSPYHDNEAESTHGLYEIFCLE
jgi:hypothetical protein